MRNMGPFILLLNFMYDATGRIAFREHLGLREKGLGRLDVFGILCSLDINHVVRIDNWLESLVAAL